MARPKKKPEVETKIEVAKKIRPYKFECPGHVQMEESQFDESKMHLYNWSNKGYFLRGGKKIICLQIHGEK